MIKRFISFILIFLFIFSLWGCVSSKEISISKNEIQLKLVDYDEEHFSVSTEWMKFFFLKEDFNKEDIIPIVEEAICIMEDVRNFLNVNYTLVDAKETLCYFDSTYLYNGENRSRCFWDERKMYCTSLSTFIHEYVHMVSNNNADIIYVPDTIMSEGLAEYIEVIFCDKIATKEYNFFARNSFMEISNPKEHNSVCNMLRINGLLYNEQNYNKAVVALVEKVYGISKLDKEGDFYKYYIGQVFVDYCINSIGNLEKFMTAYCDSITIEEIYGKSLDELIKKACDYNSSIFYD